MRKGVNEALIPNDEERKTLTDIYNKKTFGGRRKGRKTNKMNKRSRRKRRRYTKRYQ
jgi:hypothetical protein